MRISRARGRRASDANGRDRNGDLPSTLEILVRNLGDRVARSATMRVKHGVHEVVRWTVLRVTLGGIGTAIAIGGLFLLLGAGVKGLEAIHCPSWLAWLSTGSLALLVALASMKGILWPRPERHSD